MSERNPLPACLSHLGQIPGHDEMQRLRAENAELKQTVIAFLGPYAVEHAAGIGLPPGTIRSFHYDCLAECGARMDDFTREPPL